MTDAVLSTLQNGGWIFETLEPKFRESLLQKLPHAAHCTTTHLAALHYRRLNLPERPNHSKGPHLLDNTSLSTEERRFWTDAVTALGRGATLGAVDGEWKQTVAAACSLIGEALPLTLPVLENHTSYLCTVETEKFRSASHPHFFGTLFIKKVSDPVALAVSLIHELGHQELFLINLVDRLIQSESDYSLAHAPYQGVARPPIGRLHSAHALYRMIPLEERVLPEQAARHREILRRTVSSFTENEATQFGKRILNEVY